MKRIVLTGGGTAGHVSPNQALIPLLNEEGWEIHYIGSENGIEKAYVDAPLCTVDVEGRIVSRNSIEITLKEV